MLHRGIYVFLGEKVFEAARDTIDVPCGQEKNIKPLPMRQKTLIGGFTVQTFEVAHNVPNYGFLIETPSKERIVFVTDAIECKYRFKNVNCIMVECNHDDETILDNLDRREVGMSHPENHLGLSDCISFCKVNASAVTKQIILTHLSHQNINEKYAQASVQDAVPEIPVAVAHKGNVFYIENDNF